MRRNRPMMIAYSSAFLILTPGIGPGSKLNTPLSVRNPRSAMSKKRMVVGGNAAAVSRVPGQSRVATPGTALAAQSYGTGGVPHDGQESTHEVFRSLRAAAPAGTLPQAGHD